MMKARQLAVMVGIVLAWGAGPAAAGQAECGVTASGIEQPPQRDGQRQGERWPRKWWMEAADRAELGITDQQSAKIESIFQQVAPSQRERWREVQKLESEVEQLVKDMAADPAYVASQVERLHRIKGEQNATRVIMLYRMHRELTPAQRDKLKRLEARAEAERRKSPDAHNRRF